MTKTSFSFKSALPTNSPISFFTISGHLSFDVKTQTKDRLNKKDLITD